jgi:hypothetical protein
VPTAGFDAIANLGTSHSTAGLSGFLTLGASATVLLVEVGGFLSGATTYLSLTTHTVTVGTALTPLSLLGITLNGAIGTGWTEVWGLLNPPIGAQQIKIVENDGSTPAFLNGTASSYVGIAQIGPAVTNLGSPTATVPGAVSSATGNIVVNVVGSYDATLTKNAGSTQRSNMPAVATTNFVTLLHQDQPGAATVNQAATASGPWGTISVNLIAGNHWTVGATQAMTVGPTAAASFVGAVHVVNAANTAMAIAPSVAGVVQALGPPLRYVGRAPDTSSTLVTAGYALKDVANDLVSSSWVAQQVSIAAANLVTAAWIGGQLNPPSGVGAYLTQSGVTAALASGYVPRSALDADSGIAQLNSSLQVPTAQLPTLTTNSVATCYNANNPAHGTIHLTSGLTLTCLTSTIGEQLLATVNIEDPGYPYIALPFAYVQGFTSVASTGVRTVGGGDNFGLLTVTLLGQQSPIYGMGICNNDSFVNYYLVTPSAASPVQGTTPTSQPPLVGFQTLMLTGCNLQGGGNYSFTGGTGAETSLVFYVLTFPAFGG